MTKASASCAAPFAPTGFSSALPTADGFGFGNASVGGNAGDSAAVDLCTVLPEELANRSGSRECE